jgi:hypothetical protein
VEFTAQHFGSELVPAIWGDWSACGVFLDWDFAWVPVDCGTGEIQEFAIGTLASNCLEQGLNQLDVQEEIIGRVRKGMSDIGGAGAVNAYVGRDGLQQSLKVGVANRKQAVIP